MPRLVLGAGSPNPLFVFCHAVMSQKLHTLVSEASAELDQPAGKFNGPKNGGSYHLRSARPAWRGERYEPHPSHSNPSTAWKTVGGGIDMPWPCHTVRGRSVAGPVARSCFPRFANEYKATIVSVLQ